jgi:hypothetical protein
MNERLKELAVQAGAELYGCVGHENLCVNGKDADTLMRVFAELVRADEREACAALVEADGRVHPNAPDAIWSKTIAKLIRARGDK